MGVRIRGTLGDIDPLNKVPFKRATTRVQKGPLSRVSLILPRNKTCQGRGMMLGTSSRVQQPDMNYGENHEATRLLEGLTWRPRGLNNSVVSRVIIRVTPFRVLITVLITYLLSPMGLEVGSKFCGLRFRTLS